MQARVGGTLVPDSTYGLALANAGYKDGVIWPYGYTAGREAGVILLIGPAGVVVAREGDRIHGAGGSGGEGVTIVCEFEVDQSPGADAT